MRIQALQNGGAATAEPLSIPVIDPVAREAVDCFRQQAEAIAALGQRIDRSFGAALRLLYRVEGHVVITGLGKSGLVGKKMASTLASTGTPSFFLHAGEAFHGDLGMVTDHDAVILLSYSGETQEVVGLIPHLKRRGVATIGMAGRRLSTLARESDIFLDVGVDREVCPNNLAPTSSSLTTMAMGDALAVALVRMRGFLAEDFARLHPGGSLGKKLTGRVEDFMETQSMPAVDRCAPVRECVLLLARSRCPLVVVIESGQLVGTVSDTELRVALDGGSMDGTVGELMNRQPLTVQASSSLQEATQALKDSATSAAVALDSHGRVCGVFAPAAGG